MVNLLISYHSITQNPKRQTHFPFSPKIFCLQALSNLHRRCIVTLIWGEEKKIYSNVGRLIRRLGLQAAGSRSAVSQHMSSEIDPVTIQHNSAAAPS